MRIVVVEDDEDLAAGLEQALRDAGHAVDRFGDGAAAELHLRAEGADVVIVDWTLPGMPGVELIRNLRARGDAAPILILSARCQTADRIAGLDAGADDYVTKPFEMSELHARLRALARRAPHLARQEEAAGDLRYHRSSRRLFGPYGEIELSRRELALFEFLILRVGRIASKQAIADALYGVGADVEPNAVELLISRLRKKLAGCAVEIRTARGLGYMLDADAPA